MDSCYINLGAVKAKEIDGELYVSCWNFSKALAEKEREISDLCKGNDELEKQISELESKLKVKSNANEAMECLLKEQRKEISMLTSEKNEITEENIALKIDIVRVKRELETQSETTKLLFEKWFSEDAKEEIPEELRSRDLNFDLASKMLDVVELMLTDTQN